MDRGNTVPGMPDVDGDENSSSINTPESDTSYEISEVGHATSGGQSLAQIGSQGLAKSNISGVSLAATTTLTRHGSLTPHARLVFLVALTQHELGAQSVSKQVLLEQSGLNIKQLRAAAEELRNAGLMVKADTGVQLTASVWRDAIPEPVRLMRDTDDLPRGFARCWSIYPNPDARKAALQEWQKIQPDAELEERIFQALCRHIFAWTIQGRTTDKCPHFRTWLHGQRWQDEVRVGPIGPSIPKRSMNNALAAEQAVRRRDAGV